MEIPAGTNLLLAIIIVIMHYSLYIVPIIVVGWVVVNIVKRSTKDDD
jgi:hypothetical protein